MIGDRQEVIWTSAHDFPIRSARDDVWSVQAGSAGVAFQVAENGPLYVAAVRGPEHVVSASEWPELWTTTGDLITIRRGTETGADWSILQRAQDGALERTLAKGLTVDAISARALDNRDGSFWYWTGLGDLARTDGRSVSILTNYRRLGFRSPPDIWFLEGGLVNLFSDDWHVVILRRNGTIFARASAPTDGSVAGFGSQIASPEGSSVVYSLAKETPPRSTTVYLLQPGDTRGSPIYRAPGVDWVCAFPPVGWRDDRWLLFRRTDGRTLALDTKGRLPAQVVEAKLASILLSGSVERVSGPI